MFLARQVRVTKT